MKAPDKIYLQICGDCNDNDCENCKFKDLEENVTWCIDKIFKKDIEYTRTDAFIEKAINWLKENYKDYIIVDIDNKYEGIDGLFLKDFRKYMRGE